MEGRHGNSVSTPVRHSDSLFSEVYEEVKAIAARQLSKERANHTLTPTALVHEVYVKLCNAGSAKSIAEGPAEFLIQASVAMRRILVDSARRKKATKREGQRQSVELHADMGSTTSDVELVLAIEDALKRFEQQYPDLGKLVTMRFFAGLTMSEAADALQIPLRTAERQWHFARAWLRTELEN
ncbi:MAG: ECF-type sigma factor [Planctomycetaceae bacterium]